MQRSNAAVELFGSAAGTTVIVILAIGAMLVDGSKPAHFRTWKTIWPCGEIQDMSTQQRPGYARRPHPPTTEYTGFDVIYAEDGEAALDTVRA
jgi:hypothetical protein